MQGKIGMLCHGQSTVRSCYVERAGDLPDAFHKFTYQNYTVTFYIRIVLHDIVLCVVSNCIKSLLPPAFETPLSRATVILTNWSFD
ncbi:hypothetical protein CLV60_12039 [Dyadobacter jiangsuensis]|uniref:Uncharacterized protein n=1 Tax=Dyadobacter jiangsuensis TaxID=1591085 RepID=A0A2P8FLG5_9BACT|nr:hypothetical protein CLV60_12039 [Dyadobacter jiangsuensis]